MAKREKYDDAVKEYSKAEMKQHHDDCLRKYIADRGEVSVKVLSRVGKVPQSYVRNWIKEEGWTQYVYEDPEDVVHLSEKTQEFIKSAAEEYGLSEKEELFCYHYMKTLNATQAALRAGYSPAYSYNLGYNLLKKKAVQDFIKAARAQMCEELFLDPLDIIRMWAKIAMADMNDYINITPGGVTLRASKQVDGQLITEVKEGKDGVTIKLADKMKALDRLSSYLGVLPQDKAAQVRVEVLKKALQDGSDEGPIKIEIVGV